MYVADVSFYFLYFFIFNLEDILEEQFVCAFQR